MFMHTIHTYIHTRPSTYKTGAIVAYFHISTTIFLDKLRLKINLKTRIEIVYKKSGNVIKSIRFRWFRILTALQTFELERDGNAKNSDV
jgi:hypothetical protein